MIDRRGKDVMTKKKKIHVFQWLFSMPKIIKRLELQPEKPCNWPKVYVDPQTTEILNLSREYKYNFYCSLKDHNKHPGQFLWSGNIWRVMSDGRNTLKLCCAFVSRHEWTARHSLQCSLSFQGDNFWEKRLDGCHDTVPLWLPSFADATLSS